MAEDDRSPQTVSGAAALASLGAASREKADAWLEEQTVLARLHLKWGEALYWSGDKDGAKKQFASASSLDLSAADKAELTRVVHG
jgi:hypothetical protein